MTHQRRNKGLHTERNICHLTDLEHFRFARLEMLAVGKRQTFACDTTQNNEAGFRGVTYPACCSCPHSLGLVLSVTWTHTHLWTCHSCSITPGACKAILFTSKRRGPAGTFGCRKDIHESDLLSSASSILWWLNKTSSQKGKFSDFTPTLHPHTVSPPLICDRCRVISVSDVFHHSQSAVIGELLVYLFGHAGRREHEQYENICDDWITGSQQESCDKLYDTNCPTKPDWPVTLST